MTKGQHADQELRIRRALEYAMERGEVAEVDQFRSEWEQEAEAAGRELLAEGQEAEFDALMDNRDALAGRLTAEDLRKNLGQVELLAKDGVQFRTGTPVTFKYARPLEADQSRFGSELQPAGVYLFHMVDFGGMKGPGWDTGELSFRNPLVIEWVAATGEPQGWRARVSHHFGGKRGKDLSRAVRVAGYDGIVTARSQWQEAGEIVDLRRTVDWANVAPTRVLMRFARAVGLSKAVRHPPGIGWEAIPTGSHGGFRRQHGASWEYWYPSSSMALAAHEHHTEKAAFHRQYASDKGNPAMTRSAAKQAELMHEHESAAQAAAAFASGEKTPELYREGEKQAHAGKRTLGVDESVIHATVAELTGGFAVNREGKVPFRHEGQVAKGDIRVRRVTGRTVGIPVRLVVKAKEHGSVEGSLQRWTMYNDSAKRTHEQDDLTQRAIEVTIPAGEHDLETLRMNIRRVLAHEVAHAIDVIPLGGADSATIREREGGAGYYNVPSEVVAFRHNIFRELNDTATAKSVREDAEGWARLHDPEWAAEQARETGGPIDKGTPKASAEVVLAALRQHSPTWKRVEEHLTPGNRRKMIQTAAAVVSAHIGGTSSPMAKGRVLIRMALGSQLGLFGAQAPHAAPKHEATVHVKAHTRVTHDGTVVAVPAHDRVVEKVEEAPKVDAFKMKRHEIDQALHAHAGHAPTVDALHAELARREAKRPAKVPKIDKLREAEAAQDKLGGQQGGTWRHQARLSQGAAKLDQLKDSAIAEARKKADAEGRPYFRPDFRKWFGDWAKDPSSASRVVDKHGVPEEQFGAAPLKVFHGTPIGGFSSFKKEKDKGGNIFGKGFYFTADKEIATAYTEKDKDDAPKFAEGWRDPAGNEITHLTTEQKLAMLKHAGYPYKGDASKRIEPPKIGGPKDPYVRDPLWESHGNKSTNGLWAILAAQDENGKVHIPTLIKRYSDPSPEALAWNPTASPWGDKVESGAALGRNYPLPARLANVLPKGSTPITGDAQVFEVYLNIRKPVDMDAPMPMEEFRSFAKFTHEHQVGKDRQHLEQTKAKLAEHEAALAKFDKDGPRWTDDERGDHEVHVTRYREYLDHAKQRLATVEGSLEGGTPAVHGGYLDDLASSDEFKTITGGKDVTDPMTYQDLVKLKQVLRKREGFKMDPNNQYSVLRDAKGNRVLSGKPMHGILHIGGDENTLTYGDVHWLMSNGHHESGEGGMKAKFREWAEERGHDGMHHTGGWNIGEKPHSVWIAWEPNQIKATTSEGFDPGADDMYKATRIVVRMRLSKTVVVGP
jgi:hypothetical protein